MPRTPTYEVRSGFVTTDTFLGTEDKAMTAASSCRASQSGHELVRAVNNGPHTIQRLVPWKKKSTTANRIATPAN